MQTIFRITNSGILLFFLLLLGTACQQRVTYPSIPDNPDAPSNEGGIVWRDLVTKDPEAAQRFYGEVFGWTFETIGDGAYTVIKHDDDPIAGIFPMPATANSNSTAEWVVALSVPDVKSAAKKLKDSGGTLVAAPQNLRGRGPTAVVADPQGAIFSFTSASGMANDVDPGENEWLWTELWSNELKESVDYYKGVTGLEAKELEDDGREYFLFEKGDKKLVGIIQNPMENTRTHWVPYVRVSDPADFAMKVRKAGGTVIAGPTPALRNGSVVVVMDPSGAHFVAQRWPAN